MNGIFAPGEEALFVSPSPNLTGATSISLVRPHQWVSLVRWERYSSHLLSVQDAQAYGREHEAYHCTHARPQTDERRTTSTLTQASFYSQTLHD